MLRSALTTAAMAVLILPAAAADLDFYEPIEEPIIQYEEIGQDWSGFYAGAVGGYGWGNVHKVETGSGLVTDIPLRGALAGVTAGFNVQSGNLVGGVEGDLLWSGMSGSATCTTNPAYTCNANLDWLGTLRGRVGIAPVDAVLLFASGGVAVADGRGSTTPDFPGVAAVYEDTYLGWTVGGGVEVAVNEAISVKAEYNYVDLGSRTAPTGTLGTNGFTASPIIHLIKVGANYHF